MSVRQSRRPPLQDIVVTSSDAAAAELRRRHSHAEQLLSCARSAALVAAAVEITIKDAALVQWTTRFRAALQRLPPAPPERATWAEGILAKYPNVRISLPNHNDLEVRRLRTRIAEHRAGLEQSMNELAGLPSMARDAGRPVETGHRAFIEQFQRILSEGGLPPADALTVTLAAIAAGVESPPGEQFASCLKRWRALMMRTRG